MSEVPVMLRCSTLVFRGESVLLVARDRDGREEWVLPGGYPEPGEGARECARRELLEETGLPVDPRRCAFVMETTRSDSGQRVVELVFLVTELRTSAEPGTAEPGRRPQFVPITRLPQLQLRSAVAEQLSSLEEHRPQQTAPFLGNLWTAE